GKLLQWLRISAGRECDLLFQLRGAEYDCRGARHTSTRSSPRCRERRLGIQDPSDRDRLLRRRRSGGRRRPALYRAPGEAGGGGKGARLRRAASIVVI